MEFVHKSVLLSECIEGLAIREDGIYVDGTTGGAGHSAKIASRLTTGRLICIDRDEKALETARERLLDFDCDISFVHDDFKSLKSILKTLGIDKIDGILMDLGVSSYQLDERSRGFSYMEDDALLDMRMDTSAGKSARDVLADYPVEELIRVFKEYGEERYAVRIAKRIEEVRAASPIRTAGELNDIIRSCVPAAAPGGHPSKRVFMALRIEVNDELSGLEEFVSKLPDMLNDRGRICAISFHSLEDRAVKNAFKRAQDPCTCPRDFPVCVCGKKPLGRIVTKKPVLPSEEEMRENSRARSAKLRIFERRI